MHAADDPSQPLLSTEIPVDERRRRVLTEQATAVKRAMQRANEELSGESRARRKRSLLLILVGLLIFSFWRLFQRPQGFVSASLGEGVHAGAYTRIAPLDSGAAQQPGQSTSATG